MAREDTQGTEEDLSVPEKSDNQEDQDGIFPSFQEDIVTHKKLNRLYAGNITELKKNYAKVSFSTTDEMRTDELGLVHSAFVFSSADYAAAVSINKPNTVIIGSKVSFLAPAKVGDVIDFEANVKFEDLRKREVEVVGKINDIKVFQGTFYAVVLEKHIFKTKIKNVKRTY